MSLRFDDLPRAVISEQLKRLTEVFQPKTVNLERWTIEVTRSTRGWSVDEFLKAVDVCVQEGDHFPRPAAVIRSRPARKWLPREVEAVANPPSLVRCRWCHQEPYWGGYETAKGELLERMRCNCTRGPGWETERARARTLEVNPRLLLPSPDHARISA